MLANERIGRYELVSHLADGGMGQVYLGRAAGLGGFERHVLIKTLDTIEGTDEDEAVAMFLDEARVLGMLHHQHIAPVFEVNRDENGRLFLVMDYVHGHSVHEVWTRTIDVGAALPIDFTLTVVAAAAAGLHYAHTRRGPDGKHLHIVHRDVSMSNLMVGFDGAVKLIDFGIAKAAGRSTKTQIGFVKGKVGYMSPEQLRGHPVDARTDVFALGIVLYELSTMRRAFREESDRATMERIKGGQLVMPTTFIPDYPRELERIVTRALRVDARERYPDAEALRREVEALGHVLGLVLGDPAIVEVMNQLFETRAEPWEKRPTTRSHTELDVALEIVPAVSPAEEAHRATTVRRSPLRAATQAADALIVELGSARPTPKPNGVPAPIRRPEVFDSGGVTIMAQAGKDEDSIVPTVIKGGLAGIDSDRLTMPSDKELAVGNDSGGVLIVPGQPAGGVTIGGARKEFDGGPTPLPPPPSGPEKSEKSDKKSEKKKPVASARPTKLVLRSVGFRRALPLGWLFAALVLIAAVTGGVLAMQSTSGDGAAQASGQPAGKAIDAAPPVAPPVREEKPKSEPMPPVVAPPPTSVAVKITTTPADATVLLDGKRLGKTPFEGKVDAVPGPHVIKIRRRGYATTKLDVELLGDLARDVELVRSKNE